MRKPYIRSLIWLLLVGSVGLNVILTLGRIPSPLNAVQADPLLVGTWLSTDPHGFRLTLTTSAQFVLTNYGTPYGPIGDWSAKNGKIIVTWAMDEEGEEGRQEGTYSMSDNGKRIIFSKDLFAPHVTEYVSVRGQP